MPIDLHLHSNVSDGVENPTDLMALAATARMTAVALTDHDTLDGLDEATSAAHDLGLRFVPGVELSVRHQGTKMHMLVYFVDPDNAAFQQRLSDLRIGREERNVIIVENLNNLGYDLTIADVLEQADGPSIGRPHIADALIEKGYIKHRNEAFENLLHDGGAAYVARPTLSAAEAIDLAAGMGAVSVIAHPATIVGTRETYHELFRDLRDIGLGGIEAYHSMHSPGLQSNLVRIASELKIAATGGSDYHGSDKREYRIGTGTGNLRVPDSALDELEAQRKRLSFNEQQSQPIEEAEAPR